MGFREPRMPEARFLRRPPSWASRNGRVGVIPLPNAPTGEVEHQIYSVPSSVFPVGFALRKYRMGAFSLSLELWQTYPSVGIGISFSACSYWYSSLL
jgi:hypothetical protein